MAQNPEQHARDYGLSRDVAGEFEEQEGPPTGAQHGETRTRIPERADRLGHGPKTQARIKETINGKGPGGTH
jgi:hypothetical protein